MTPKPNAAGGGRRRHLAEPAPAGDLVAHRVLHRLVWAETMLPCADRSFDAPGGSPPNRLVSSTISCGAAARSGSTSVTRKSSSPVLCTVSAPRTARSMIVAAVSRVSTWPSTSRPASATGIRGGVNATGMAMSGSLAPRGAGLPGQRHGARRQTGVALVAAVLAPPQHADQRRTDQRDRPDAGQGDRARPARRGQLASRPVPGAARCRPIRPDLILTPMVDPLPGGQVGLAERGRSTVATVGRARAGALRPDRRNS